MPAKNFMKLDPMSHLIGLHLNLLIQQLIKMHLRQTKSIEVNKYLFQYQGIYLIFLKQPRKTV